jgi:hypothetical protein
MTETAPVKALRAMPGAPQKNPPQGRVYASMIKAHLRDKRPLVLCGQT